MKAAIYEAFREPLTVGRVADPVPAPDGVVLEVAATGVCRKRLARLDGARSGRAASACTRARDVRGGRGSWRGSQRLSAG